MSKETTTQRIAAALRQQTTTGDLGPGALLPSETELAQQWNVSRNTARAALQMLEHEGIISVLPRRGRVVRQRYRVFLSTPMAALADEEYETDRIAAKELFDKLDEIASPVYWAAANIHSSTQFEAPDIATAKNMTALTVSNAFVYVQQRELTHPTSALIELGIALANKMPITIFAPSEEMLPYTLRRFEAISMELGFGRFRFYCTQSVQEAIRLLQVHGPDLLGLDHATNGETQ